MTLVAGGGTGKTRLAIEVGDQEAPHFSGGVWFVDLTELTDDHQVAAAVARAVGFRLQTSEPIAEAAAFVARQPLLLVLDNCEHVVDACAEFGEAMLRAGGNSRLLATSREWLDIDGEQIHQVPALDAGAIDSPAVLLFVERALSVNGSFDLDEHNAADVIALCQHLDGVPLAIELAASRSAVLGPAELLAGLSDRFRLLSGGRRRQRRRTLEATIDWSYDLLPPEEQRAFAALGVFVGGFDLTAAAAVCGLPAGRAVDIVESLITKSLVLTVGGGRFRLLETVKAYAEHRLVETGQIATVWDRHLNHFAACFGFPDPPAHTDIGSVVHLMDDVPNGLGAADWAERNGRWSELARLLVGGLSAALTVQGDPHGALARLERCEGALDDDFLVGRVQQDRLYYLMQLANWAEYMKVARRLSNAADPYLAATGYFVQSLLFSRHDPDRAEQLIGQGAALRTRSDLDDHRLEELSYRSYVILQQEELSAAEPIAEAILAAAADAGVAWNMGVGLAHWTLAACAWARGDHQGVRARVLHGPGVEDAYMQDPLGLSGIAFFLALAELGDGDLADATALVRDFALVAETGRMALEANDAVVLLAALSLRDGDTEHARRLVMKTGSPRSPTSTAVVQEVARRLAIHEELESVYRNHASDPEWLIDTPKRVLSAEVEARGWSSA